MHSHFLKKFLKEKNFAFLSIWLFLKKWNNESVVISIAPTYNFKSPKRGLSPTDLKLKSAIFYDFFIFCRMLALQKLWKMFFISSKKLFRFSRYSDFCISVFPSFSPVSHCFRGWSKINLKVYDIINCLNKNLITHFVWCLGREKRYDIETLSIDRVLSKEHFYWKIMQKMSIRG